MIDDNTKYIGLDKLSTEINKSVIQIIIITRTFLVDGSHGVLFSSVRSRYRYDVKEGGVVFRSGTRTAER